MFFEPNKAVHELFRKNQKRQCDDNGYSVREIASILRVPESTVKTRLFRARQQLKSLLEREEMFA